MTISVTTEVIREAEKLGARRGFRSRSAVVEEALRLLVGKLRAEEIAASLDAYYGGQTSEERKEEGALVDAFQRKRRGIDLDGRPRLARNRRR